MVTVLKKIPMTGMTNAADVFGEATTESRYHPFPVDGTVQLDVLLFLDILSWRITQISR